VTLAWGLEGLFMQRSSKAPTRCTTTLYTCSLIFLWVGQGVEHRSGNNGAPGWNGQTVK
jgi:hypothetical protein